LITLEDKTPGFKDLYVPTHKKLCDFIAKYDLPGHKSIYILPRGWVKSGILTVGYKIQRDLRCWVWWNKKELWSIISAVMDNSQEFLKRIKENYLYNELLRKLFHQWIPKDPENTPGCKWTEKEIQISGCRINLGAVEKGLTSRHFGGGIIFDDMVIWENSRSADQILKTIDFWKLAQSLIMPSARQFIPGTRYDYDDLYGFLLQKFFGMTHKKWEKLMERPWFELHNEEGNWHYLHFQAWDDPIHEKGSTFPVLYPEHRIKELLISQEDAFGGQYLGDPLAQAKRVFKPEWLRARFDPTDVPRQVNTLMTIDPCGKDTSGSDYSGMVVTDAGVDKKIYIQYAQRQKATDLNLIEWICEVAPIYQPGMIGIEENKFDTICDLAQYHIPQLIRAGKIPKEHIEYVRMIPNLFVELKHRGRPKHVRIANLTGYFQSGKMILARSGMQDLIDELLRFGKTKRDDILDALAYVLDLLIFPIPTDPEKTFVLTEEQKMTIEEREKKSFEDACKQAERLNEEILDDFEEE
jgi:phage terminase large subunit-like protein